MKLRFIAGAVCPACSEMDTVQGMLQDGSVAAARCVACGWESTNPQANPQQQANRQRGNDEAIAVRVLDPAAKPPEGTGNRTD